MNSVAIGLIWSAVQGTLLLGVGVALYLWAVRRGPRTAAWLAGLVLAMLALIVPLSFCPLPSWYRMDFPIRPGESGNSSNEAAENNPPSLPHAFTLKQEGHGVTLPVRELLEHLRAAVPSGQAPGKTWSRWLAPIFVAGTSASLLYWLLGLIAVARLRRRSRPIHDSTLPAVFEALRAELRCGAAIELRECADIGSAATVGWRRPVILLPDDWRSWSSDERRAVLAHELAHIRRRDYPIWLLARFSVALHFYNPLAHWMASRLQLQQELAADAEGAACAGGTRTYLQAVARLALRQDRWLRCWPARAFLAGGGTWKRRIAMLQKQNPHKDQGWSKLRRWSAAGALLIVALGAGMLRIVAQPSSSTAPPPADKQAATSVSVAVIAPRPKFDLSYIPHNAKGVYGFRPSVLCYCSALQPFIAEFNGTLAKELPAVLGFKGEFDLKVEDIEQMTGIVEIKRMPNNTNALLTSFSMMRIAHDYDWAKRIKIWLPESTVHQHNGQSYFKAPAGFLAMLGMGLEPCAFVPDSRTIVCGDEAFIKGVIDSLGKSRPQAEWLKDWDAVDQGWLAVAFDNRDFHLAHDINKDGKPPMPLTPICEKATSFVLGLEGGQGYLKIVKHADGTETTSGHDSNLIVTGRAQFAGEKSAAEVRETIVGLFKQARDWAAHVPVNVPSKDKPTAGQVLSELLNPQIERHGTTLAIRAETKQSLIAVKLALDELEVHEDAKVEK